MDTRQILTILRSTIGNAHVVPSDKLPTKIPYKPCAMVINTDPSYKPGMHWVAIYIPAASEPVEYFDSYGQKPNISSIRNFITKFPESWYNNQRLQGPLSSVCGHYCIYFLIKRWQGYSTDQILGQFSNDYEENDAMITEWLNSNFDIDTDTYDIEFLANQICSSLETKGLA